MASVKCKYCGEFVDKKDVVGSVGYWHHDVCLKIVEAREMFITYTINLFGHHSTTDKNAITNNRRISTNYKNKYNYTYKGMWRALVYFYEVKQNSLVKSGARIGIIPYVYNEAQEYFEQLDEKVKATMEIKYQELKTLRDLNKLKKKHEEQRDIIDLNNI